MIDNLTDATRLLNATQLMLLGKDNQPISDLYYALQIAVDSIEELKERREADTWNVIHTEADLPKKDGEYMVIVSSCYGYTFEIGDIDIYKFEAGKFQTDTPVEITHWKPLPKIPESDDNK